MIVEEGPLCSDESWRVWTGANRDARTRRPTVPGPRATHLDDGARGRHGVRPSLGFSDSRLTRPAGWRWAGLRPMAALPDLAVELLEKGAPARRFDSADIVLDLHAGN